MFVGALENIHRRIQRAMYEQLASPIEQVAFTRIHVRSGLVLIFGRDKFAILFFNFPEHIVQVRSIFLFQEILNQIPAGIELACFGVGKR